MLRAQQAKDEKRERVIDIGWVNVSLKKSNHAMQFSASATVVGRYRFTRTATYDMVK